MVGKIAISLAVWSLTRGRNSLRNARDSLGVLYIFQLAAINGFRMCGSVFHLAAVVGRPEVTTALAVFIWSLICTSPPRQKVCKVFKIRTIASDCGTAFRT